MLTPYYKLKDRTETFKTSDRSRRGLAFSSSSRLADDDGGRIVQQRLDLRAFDGDDLSTIPGDFEQTATTLVSTRSVFSVAMATSVRPPVFDDDFDSQVGLHRFTASQCVNEVSGTLH